MARTKAEFFGEEKPGIVDGEKDGEKETIDGWMDEADGRRTAAQVGRGLWGPVLWAGSHPGSGERVAPMRRARKDGGKVGECGGGLDDG